MAHKKKKQIHKQWMFRRWNHTNANSPNTTKHKVKYMRSLVEGTGFDCLFLMLLYHQGGGGGGSYNFTHAQTNNLKTREWNTQLTIQSYFHSLSLILICFPVFISRIEKKNLRKFAILYTYPATFKKKNATNNTKKNHAKTNTKLICLWFMFGSHFFLRQMWKET